MDGLINVMPVFGVLALLFFAFKIVVIMKNDEGTDKMKEIAQHIRVELWRLKRNIRC